MKKPKVKHRTKAEHDAARHYKRKHGPSALKRKARRLHLQPKPPEPVTVGEDKHGE